MAQAVVLVVEDNEKSLKLACDLLRLRDYEALAASTGADAVRLACERLPDLVLMDVQLPDMDGGSALATLRGKPQTARIPVIAVTAYAMKGDRERLLAQGFDGYISKPIDVRSFVDDVSALIGCRK